MKQLNKWQNALFRTSAIALVVGLALHLFMSLAGTLIYAVGILGFSSMQMLTTYNGTSITLKRLRHQQVLSDFLFLLSAAAMVAQEFNFGPSWAHGNVWTLLLVICCVLQLYTAFRIPNELEKEKSKIAPFFFLPLLLPVFSSCQTQYQIEGSTNIGYLEGKKLYLNGFNVDSMITLDSCTVQHGRIQFSGALDSTQMVSIFLQSESLMPLVLEEGIINLVIDDVNQEATGTPLNDTLTSFIREKLRLDTQMSELPRMESKLIMDGVPEYERERILIAESEKLIADHDRLVTSFVVRHSDNVLGPGVFMILTSGFTTPQLTPQIEEIMFRAKPYLKEHPYVKQFMEEAKINSEKIHTGAE
ncbi:MAG: DUF4369 domain-containing protein [Bacteroidales bacterium]|nr:DUF4369 domain-containing protein [Candidatus Physcousia equi]